MQFEVSQLNQISFRGFASSSAIDHRPKEEIQCHNKTSAPDTRAPHCCNLSLFLYTRYTNQYIPAPLQSPYISILGAVRVRQLLSRPCYSRSNSLHFSHFFFLQQCTFNYLQLQSSAHQTHTPHCAQLLLHPWQDC